HLYRSEHVDVVNNTAWNNMLSSSTYIQSGEIDALDSSDVNVINNVAVNLVGKAVTYDDGNHYDYNLWDGARVPFKWGHDIPRMNVLLVQPLAPKTYWGFQYAVGMVGKGAPHPPLGLATLAALLPGDWDLRIADLNVAPLGEGDLRWADAALVTGMLVHKDA